MVNQDSSAVKCLFVLCFFNLLNVALFQVPPPPSDPLYYYATSAHGELGVRFTYEPSTTGMQVTISYDTEAVPAKAFFNIQLNEAVFNNFAQCPLVKMSFYPCTMAQIQNGALFCLPGSNECNDERRHACVANILNKSDPVLLGKFVTCTFADGKTIDQCISDNNIDQQAVNTCVQNGAGDAQCIAFYQEIANEKKRYPTAAHPLPGESEHDATVNFVKNVCLYLAQANIACDAAC